MHTDGRMETEIRKLEIIQVEVAYNGGIDTHENQRGGQGLHNLPTIRMKYEPEPGLGIIANHRA